MPTLSKLGKYTPEQFARVITDKSYLTLIPDDAVKKGLDFVLENYPFADMSIEQFKTLLRKPNSTLKVRQEIYRKYSIGWNNDPLDHWVAESLKVFDRQFYDSMKGYTKVARVTRAYSTLLKFSRPLVTSAAIKSRQQYRAAYEGALDYVKRLFKGKKFDTLTAADYMKQIPQNTAAGFPYIGKKKGEVWSEVHRKSVANYVQLASGKKLEPQPCTLALRGHLSPIDEVKTRPVWVVPFETIVMENIMFRSIYDFMFQDKEMSELILTGKDTLFRLRTYLSISTQSSFINLDYSSWDAWRCRFAGMDLFNVLKSVINFKKGEEGIFYFVRKAFLNAKLLLPDGTVLEKEAGTPSGSLLTALFNSLLNVVILKTCNTILDVDRNIEHLKVLGDDAGFYYGSALFTADDYLDRLSTLAMELFGMQLNPKKCLVTQPDAPTEDKKFIGYSIRNNQLYREEEDFFLSCLYPEHEVDSAVVSFSRVFSYFLLGASFHQKFTTWFQAYLGHYWHILSKQERLLTEEVFKMGNLRVVKHVFQIEVDEFLNNFDVNKLRSIDFMQFPYFLTLSIPLERVFDSND